MKIAHISAFYKPTIGGVEKVMEELATRQVRDGHEVHVFCSDFDKNQTIELKDEIIERVHVHRCKLLFKISQSGLICPSLYKRIVEEHEKAPFDIVHSHVFGHLHFVQSARFARKFKVKHIHTTHCPWTDANRSLMGKIGIFVSYNLFSKKAMKKADKIVAITPWELEFIKKYGGKEEKISYITNGVPEEFFNKIENNNFKKEHNIKGKMVLFFGRLNITKGPEKFVEIAKLILQDRNDITFVIRGPDEGMKEKVKELIGDEKRIILLDETRDKNEIIKMYQAAEVFVMPSFREGMPLCCHPDTLIETEKGLKEISKIETNEMVLTHKGQFCKVLKTMKREIDEEIICIKPWGVNQEIKLTKEHPVLAIKRPKKTSKNSLGLLITKSAPEWIEAKDLKKGDCVVFPILQCESNLEQFDLFNFDSSLNYSSDKVWYKMGFSSKNKDNSYSRLVKDFGETKRVIEDAVKYFKKGDLPKRSKRINKILNLLKENKFNSVEPNRYHRFIKIDEEMAYVLGWYIAEGSTNKSIVRFALNKEEIEYAEKINKIMNDKFDIKGTISIDKNRLSLTFSSKIVGIFFSKLCGIGAKNKRIPSELFNQKLLPYVLKGLFLGDGHFNKAGWTLTTISKQLANDTILALMKMRKKFNYHESDRRDTNAFSKNIIYSINYQPDNLNISHNNKSWFVGDNLCFLVKTVKKERYLGTVYNLEVENDNSYTTSSFCVHNCLMEAFACGLPVVASPVNGIPFELIDYVNGFLANYGDNEWFANRIQRLLDDEPLRKRISKTNFEKAKQYDWDIIHKKYLEVYNA